MTEKPNIIHNCTIFGNTVTLDGKVIFESSPEMNFNAFTKSLYTAIGLKYPMFFKMDNLSKLGFLAAEVLLQQVPDFENFNKQKTGIFLSNAYSCLDTDEQYYATVKDEENFFPSPGLFVYTLPNILIGEICIRHKITGEHAFFLSEQFDADFTCLYVNDLFGANLIESALVGWAEYYKEECKATLMWVTQSDTRTNATPFIAENVKAIWQ